VNRRAASALAAFVIGAAGKGSGPAASAPAFVSTPCAGMAIAGARCGVVKVPENRERQAGRTIALKIVVIPPDPGANAAPDPVFFLAGGPGQAATAMADDSRNGVRPARRRRALVFADQRGTGGSNGLDCRFYGPPHDAQSYFDRFMPPARVRECRQRLEETADLAQYTTQNSVQDLDDIRAALGFDTINLVGGSYGTRLAMEYVRRFEPHVRSVILQGAVPPSLAMPARFGQLAQHALDGILADCRQDPVCGRTFPGITVEAQAVFARLRKGPVSALVSHPSLNQQVTVRVTRENVAEAVRYMTYTSADAARVPAYLHAAFTGNYSPLAQFLLDWRADGMFEGLYLSITCAEDLPFVPAAAAEADDGTYLSGYRVREQRAGCAEWPRGRSAEQQRQPVASAVPVLIVAGELDPVTPPVFAEEVARTLANAVQVRVPHGGHSPAGLAGLDCLAKVEDAFLEKPRPDGLDTSCVSQIKRRSFALHP
jgi:pimeloyl-ACP methyl ester carboxylesterase